MTTEEILADYEDLEREDILAALELAARLSQTKRFDFLGITYKPPLQRSPLPL